MNTTGRAASRSRTRTKKEGGIDRPPSEPTNENRKAGSALGDHNVHLATAKADDAVHEGEERVIATATDIVPGLERRAALADDNRPGADRLAA